MEQAEKSRVRMKSIMKEKVSDNKNIKLEKRERPKRKKTMRKFKRKKRKKVK